ncbi:MAG: YfhO family protein [candidate division KSB1 bacterium]|nr:YfhO family protein [candidate division KSB1 bacterium]MDZ7274907.1 YfhO family protein [candidate division KSB1 bacterium]MDZ7286641.1 YfhO family protein [candidate division KSB1 bacterium]MDZ7299196.1 YfhO family protein [candidate division KSB1 bacterium]MDZ7308496.1 YfhO family protein [candidate division KSB1 bacterium]
MSKKTSSHRRAAAAGGPGRTAATSPTFTWFTKHPVLSASGVYLLLMLVFFFETIFLGKTYLSPDAQAPLALSAPLKKALWEEGVYPQWLPHIFGGMPSFASLTYNPLAYFPHALVEVISRVVPVRGMLLIALHYVLAGLGVFLFLRRKGADYLPALLGGLAFMLTPYLITMIIFGHGSQMMTAAYLPLALWAVDRLLEKVSLRNIGLAGLTLGSMLQRGHIQIAYYGLMLVGFFVLYELATVLLRKQAARVLPMLGGFAAAVALALALAAILFLPVQEYTPHSIRGSASVLQTTQAEAGVGFDYATQWSFSPGEMMTFLLPSFYGFGGMTYWGTMPFTDYPNYMGILVLALAIFALIKRVPHAGFLGASILLALLISFGHHFESFYRLFYDYFPHFNKFRVPVMILVLVQGCVAILAGLGLQALLQPLATPAAQRASRHAGIAKNLWRMAGVLLLLALLITVFQSSLQQFMAGLYPDQYDPATQARLDEMRFDMLFGDWWKLTLLAGTGLVMLALAFAGRIAPRTAAAVIVVLTLIDLWIVDKKIGNPPAPERNAQAVLQPDAVALFLQQDKSLYRIYPTLDLFRETHWAAQDIHSVGGYHAAKPRRYQDFLEATDLQSGLLHDYFTVVVENGRQGLQPKPVEAIPAERRTVIKNLLDLLNVKYILAFFPLPEENWVSRATVTVNYQGGAYPLHILENTTALPRAFLVGRYEVQTQNLAALQRLAASTFDPHTTVLLEQPPALEPQPDTTARAIVTEYQLHHLTIETSAAFPQILVLSDNYYPPGWHAYLDGKPVKTQVANYCFRGVAVPAGQHRIEFRYASRAFTTGVWLSLGALVLCAGFIFAGRRHV